MKAFFPFLLIFSSSIVWAEDWPRFRGPQGNGVSTDTKVPLNWNDQDNLKWKLALPGPGSSSPIVSGDRVFVTCYSSYGTNRSDVENISRIKRSNAEFMASGQPRLIHFDDPVSGSGFHCPM